MRRIWLWTALALTIIGTGSYGLYRHLQSPPLPDQLLYGNGHIEGSEVRVAAEVAGRVVDSRLVEGEEVAAGALLVRLDDEDLVLRRESAAAEIDALRRMKEQTASELQVARHHLETARGDLDRYRELRERGAAPAQQAEQAENAFEAARGQVGVLEAAISAADARIAAAETELRLAANAVEKTRIKAPVAGTMLAKAVEAGEVVQPGQPVAVLVDLSRLELKAFIPERDIGKVALGAPARVRIDAFPDRAFEGRVAQIDQQAQFTPRDIHMPEERTRMVFGVTIALDNPDNVLKPGMPADAWILWDPDAEWPDRLSVPG